MQIKYYVCQCGEDVYEDDDECVNCGAEIDPLKFVLSTHIEIIEETDVEEVELPLLKS